MQSNSAKIDAETDGGLNCLPLEAEAPWLRRDGADKAGTRSEAGASRFQFAAMGGGFAGVGGTGAGDGAAGVFENISGWAAVHVPVAAVLVGGLLLGLYGKRLLKPLYTLVFAATIGVVCALMLPNVLSDRVFGVPSPVVGVAVGLGLGMLLAYATFRFALAMCTSVTAAVVATLVAAVYLSTVTGGLPTFELEGARIKASLQAEVGETGRAHALREAEELLRRTERTIRGGFRTKTAPPDGINGEQQVGAIGAQATRNLIDRMFTEVRATWAALPAESRMVLVASALAGAMLGFALGLVAPMKAGAALTAMAGAMMCVMSGAWLLAAAGVVRPSLFDRGPQIWLAIWAGLALAGFVYQLPRAKSKPPEGQAAADRAE